MTRADDLTAAGMRLAVALVASDGDTGLHTVALGALNDELRELGAVTASEVIQTVLGATLGVMSAHVSYLSTIVDRAYGEGYAAQVTGHAAALLAARIEGGAK